jgi:glycosyltransferase involved in cell wall biosynthesis
MRIGLIARADDRGLSHLTWEFARNIRPDKILIVDMGDERFPTYHDRYDALADLVVVWSYQHGDRSPDAHRWLEGLDVVFTAETFYGLDNVIENYGVKTVKYVMPEFYRADDPKPTATWLPTWWLADDVPFDLIMEWPCPADRWFNSETPLRRQNETLRVVMPAGNRALHDRNGSKIFLQALRHVKQPVEATVWTQDRTFSAATKLPINVSYQLRRHATNYWDIAAGAHLVVIPRRYGGLSLPAIEALGAGAALAMTDCDPNRMWPIEPIGCKPGFAAVCPFGEVQMWDAEPRDLAHLIDYLAADPALTRARQEEAREWAHRHSWQRQRDRWITALEEVSER